MGFLLVVGGSALFAGGLDYGIQVYNNYQQGKRGWDAWTSICWGEVGIAALDGATTFGLGYVLGPLGTALSRAGFVGRIAYTFIDAFVTSGVSQAITNLGYGRPWHAGMGRVAQESGQETVVFSSFRWGLRGLLRGGRRALVGSSLALLPAPRARGVRALTDRPTPRQFFVDPDGVAHVGVASFSRQERIDLLVGRLGTNIQTHPLRQAYQRDVENIANVAAALKVERGTSEAALRSIAYDAWLMRRQLGVKYKNATPLALRDHIYAVNIERYQDPLGPSFQNRVEYYGYDYERMIERAAFYNDKVDKLLGDFGPWLADQSDDQLERYVQDLLTR